MAFIGTLRTSYRTGRAADRPKRRRKPLLLAAAQLIGQTAARLALSWTRLRTLLLSLVAFALIDGGLWQLPSPYNRIAGLIGAGVGVLILEALADGDG